MKTKSKIMLGAAIPAIALAASNISYASSHREAPAIANDPCADNTDTYAWMSADRSKLYVVANYIPLEEPAGGPNFHKFCDDVRYEIHITRGGDSLDDALAYYFTFSTSSINYVDPADLTAAVGGGKEFFAQLSGQTQTYSIQKFDYGRRQKRTIAQGVMVAPVNIGPRTDAVIRGGVEYNDAYINSTFIHNMGAEGRVFAGPRDDAFYVDLGGVFDLANLRPQGVAQDGVAGYNTHTIALEIPVERLTADGQAPGSTPGNATTLGIWAAASRRKISIQRTYDGEEQFFGPYIQVSRLGLPLVNEALIGLQDKDKWNRSHPSQDVPVFGAYFLNPVVVRDAEAVGIYAALGVDPTPFKSGRLDIINIINLTNIPTEGAHSIPLTATGDVLRVDMATASGFPNGRSLQGGARPDQEQADVTDVLLTVILSGGALAISDGANYNDKPLLNEFPFLALPWRGFDQGHGVPTPQ
jgi:hypothetical protein